MQSYAIQSYFGQVSAIFVVLTEWHSFNLGKIKWNHFYREFSTISNQKFPGNLCEPYWQQLIGNLTNCS